MKQSTKMKKWTWLNFIRRDARPVPRSDSHEKFTAIRALVWPVWRLWVVLFFFFVFFFFFSSFIFFVPFFFFSSSCSCSSSSSYFSPLVVTIFFCVFSMAEFFIVRFVFRLIIFVWWVGISVVVFFQVLITATSRIDRGRAGVIQPIPETDEKLKKKNNYPEISNVKIKMSRWIRRRIIDCRTAQSAMSRNRNPIPREKKKKIGQKIQQSWHPPVPSQTELRR